jgi:hypothetical protein
MRWARPQIGSRKIEQIIYIKRELRENSEKEHKPRKANQHSALSFAGACGEFPGERF